jgi:hypothetical protein
MVLQNLAVVVLAQLQNQGPGIIFALHNSTYPTEYNIAQHLVI